MAKTEKLPKKKKSLFRRILKWTGISFLVLLIAIILIPILFKSEIIQMVKDEVNKTLKADVDFDDPDLTFLSTFPNVTIQVNNVSVTGRTEFKGVKLADIKNIEAQVNLWDVIGGDQIEIDAVSISDAKFDVRVSPDGKANYDIVIPTEELPAEQQEEPSAFKLSLQEYSLNNVDIVYDDQASDMYANIKNLVHTGAGDMTAEVFDFATETSMDALTFEMEGLSYLSDVKTKATVNLNMEMNDQHSKFTLAENSFNLNNFACSLDGFYEMLDKHDNMDLKLNTNQISFKDLLSLVPTFYQSGYESMVAKGDVKVNAEVKGKLDDKNLPGWDFGLMVKKASIKYAGVPGTINNINVDAGSQFDGGEDLDKMTLDVKKFHADFVGNLIDATLKMRNPMTDPLLASRIKAKVNMATLGQVMPLAEGESYKGKLNADIDLNGRMSAIEKEQYEQFNAKGVLELFDFLYKTKDLNETVDVKRMTFRFSPRNLALEQMEAKMGKSDFEMKGTIDNYMGYIFRNELLKGDFTFNSNNLDLDNLMGVTPTSSAAPASSEPAAAESAAEPVLIPENVDFNLNTSINTLKYNGLAIKNVSGNVNMKEEVASLNNLTMNTMGGSVGLRGSYNSKDHNKPAIDFGYNLKEVSIEELTKHFLTIEKLAPIAKYAKGNISSNLNMKSSLTASLEPILSSLNGDGDMFTNLVTVSGFEPMKKTADALSINKLENQTIKDVKAKFKFADGRVTVNPFNVKLSGIDTKISGFTTFDQLVDYKLDMKIPKEMIPASMVKAAETMMAKVNNLTKLNVASFPDFIPVTTLIGGTVTKPVIKTDFKEAILKATGNFKENMVNNIKETVKDTVKKVIDNKVQEVKEDLNKKKQEILDDAQKQADKIVADAKKAGDRAREEAETACEAAYKEAGNNPIKKKAADVSCEQARKTANKKADKLEAEAQEKADKIMATAQQKADAIK